MNIVIFILATIVVFGGIAFALYWLHLRQKSALAAVEVLNIRLRDAALSTAIHAVWVQLFAMKLEVAPRVDWVGASQLDCFNGRGWHFSNGMCVAGASWEDVNVCAVAWPAGTTKISNTAFAHELAHALRWHVGTPDPNHTGPDFQPGGIVDQANAALKAAGL